MNVKKIIAREVLIMRIFGVLLLYLLLVGCATRAKMNNLSLGIEK
jgi:outer membrane murein-binding lipoprotein Lpp